MVAVLDFGSQYTHLITRRIREQGVKAEIFQTNVTEEILKEKKVKAIVLSGGPSSVYEKDAPKFDKSILLMGLPVLGICYGHQLIVHVLGGEVKPGKVREYGEEVIYIKTSGKILDGLDNKETVWFSHGDSVTYLPQGFKVLATTRNTDIASFGSETQKIYGVQFHPEVVHTPKGKKIIENFLFKVCKLKKDWNIKNLKHDLVSSLKDKIQNENVIIGVSGGVDSMVVAELLNIAIPERLYCIFINTGLMRKGEAEEVEDTFNNLSFKHFEVIDASSKFLSALKRITDPELKRKTFSKVYFDVFIKAAKKLKKKASISYLAQGTIYPDRVESGKTSSTSQLIKSHHNLSVPHFLKLKILEPLADFYKDEVRELGISLGLEKKILMRHPFPGPGLAIRILGEITIDRIRILQEADVIFIEELKSSNQYDKVWQAFAALLPIRAVGVMGDHRTYDYIIALRAVTSVDGMTADWARLPDELLKRVSGRIVNEVRGVNRVLYDISQKPPATIEFE